MRDVTHGLNLCVTFIVYLQTCPRAAGWNPRYRAPGGCNTIDNSSIERADEFKYLGTRLTNQNSIQEEIKRRLKSGNACYYSVQNLLSSRLLSKNLKIKLYRTIILPVVLYGCETWSLTLREERRLRVFENRVLRVFGPKRDEVRGNGENYIMRSLGIFTPYPILCGW